MKKRILLLLVSGILFSSHCRNTELNSSKTYYKDNPIMFLLGSSISSQYYTYSISNYFLDGESIYLTLRLNQSTGTTDNSTFRILKTNLTNFSKSQTITGKVNCLVRGSSYCSESIININGSFYFVSSKIARTTTPSSTSNSSSSTFESISLNYFPFDSTLNASDWSTLNFNYGSTFPYSIRAIRSFDTFGLMEYSYSASATFTSNQSFSFSTIPFSKLESGLNESDKISTSSFSNIKISKSLSFDGFKKYDGTTATNCGNNLSPYSLRSLLYSENNVTLFLCSISSANASSINLCRSALDFCSSQTHNSPVVLTNIVSSSNFSESNFIVKKSSNGNFHFFYPDSNTVSTINHYISKDQGLTWEKNTSFTKPTLNSDFTINSLIYYRGIEIINDTIVMIPSISTIFKGEKLSTGSGFLYTSSDLGVTWVDRTSEFLK